MGAGASNQVRSGPGTGGTVEHEGNGNGADCTDCSRPSSAVKSKQLSSEPEKKFVKKNTKVKDDLKSTRTLPVPKILTPVQPTNLNKKPIPSISKTSVTSLPTTSEQSSSKLEELTEKVKHLEIELASSESLCLDAADQIQILEEKVASAHDNDTNTKGDCEDLSETVHAKDQLILKLQNEFKTCQSEANTNRLKLKKRIRHLTNQLHETRQDASISQMELKSEITLLKERLKDRGDAGQASNVEALSDDGGHSKVIVELSNQMSEQSDRIVALEAQLAAKDSLIVALESKQSQQTQKNDNVEESKSDLPTPSGDRLQSGRGSRSHKPSSASKPKSAKSKSKHVQPADNDTFDDSMSRPSYTRMSTALSDSDSDWEVNESRPGTRSAPARVRVKSAASTQSKRSVARQAGVTPDDDSIMQYVSPDPINSSHRVRDTKTSEGRTHPHNRSALKKHLDKQKHDAESGSLLGPSVAFALTPDMPSSCEPTPRYGDPRGLPGFSELTVINTIHQ